MTGKELINIENVSRRYRMGDNEIIALNNASLTISEGELVAIMGPSGSGKSTLMNLVGCLDRPTEGRIRINNRYTEEMDSAELARLRNREVGFIFQQFHLLGGMSLLHNVATPLLYCGIPLAERNKRAVQALSEVGLGSRIRHHPHELSGGQRQRTAVARALINNPSILLADEPTGALDSVTGAKIMALFKTINSKGKTVIIVTHDPNIAAQCDRTIRLMDGKVMNDD